MSATAHPGQPGAGGIVPSRAPVVPRVRLTGQEAAVPIEERVRAILRKTPRCLINLTGPSGSGKTTALAHLRAALEPDRRLLIVDQHPNSNSDVLAELDRRPMLLSSRQPLDVSAFATIEMAPWTDDDLAEYLLATHPGRCRAVMRRLCGDLDRTMLGGLPELCRIVLDEMAADDSACTIDAALTRFLDRQLSDPDVRAVAEQAAFASVACCDAGETPRDAVTEGCVARLVRHPEVSILIAARRLVEDLQDGSGRSYLCGRMPLRLVERIATLSRPVPRALQALDALTREPDFGPHAMAASILRAACIGWRPDGKRVPNLNEAWLAGVEWDGIGLPGCAMTRADLRAASLANADLPAAVLDGAQLAGATLRNAWLRAASLKRADLSRANLAGITGDSADFAHCNLKDANLCGASLRGALLRHAELTNAAFRRADLADADLSGSRVDGADFCEASLANAKLVGLALSGCTVGSTSFRGADLSRCSLEGLADDEVDFEGATLNDSMLTGSILRSARFHSAKLRGCGLAEIDWAGADLRDADLRGSTFHMGTTRSGLVGSTVPGEGSRTGFYTDEFYDTDFKDPEEVRKANLRGADLRGANIENVDFYLVDLRDARYSPEQADWLRRCGAILDS